MEQLQPLLDLFGGQKGALAQWLIWLMSLQTAMKFINGWLQKKAEEALRRVVSTEDEEDDHIAVRILNSRAYRICAFLFDLVFRWKWPLKLPPKPREEGNSQ